MSLPFILYFSLLKLAFQTKLISIGIHLIQSGISHRTPFLNGITDVPTRWCEDFKKYFSLIKKAREKDNANEEFIKKMKKEKAEWQVSEWERITEFDMQITNERYYNRASRSKFRVPRKTGYEQLKNSGCHRLSENGTGRKQNEEWKVIKMCKEHEKAEEKDNGRKRRRK